MSDPETQPIVVHATPTQPQVEAAIRQIILALGPVATLIGYQGWAGASSAILAAVGPIATVIVFLWGQYETRKNAKKAVAMADALPDSVAKTR